MGTLTKNPAPGGAPPATAAVSLSIVVPATDDPATLARCREALARAGAATDDVVVVREPAGLGPAAARNAGAATSAADVLVFVDADVEVAPDALARIRCAFTADPSLDALVGSYDDRPAAPGVVSRFRNLLHHHVHHEAAGEGTTFWTGLGAVRRDAFAAAGGFDAERYTAASIEDVELGLRLSTAGRRIVVDPAVRGTHLKRWTLVSMVRTDFAHRALPWLGLLLEGREGATALNATGRHRASAAASVALVAGVLARRPRPAAAAAGALVVLNRSFYALLARREGPVAATAGVGLHALHHLTAVAAIPVAAVRHLRRR